MMTEHVCRICGKAHGHRCFPVREMMFGTREEFEYFCCSECGAVQISVIPSNLGAYYGAYYYSMLPPEQDASWLERFAKRCRASYWMGCKSSLIGRCVVSRFGVPPYLNWLKHADVRFDDAVLDVGCGLGHVLLEMHWSGWKNLTGIDPFVDEDIDYGNGLRILKQELSQMEGCFDFIMLNHVFEHVPDLAQTLRDIHRLLKPGHCVLLRTPFADSEAFGHYQQHWFQLDAPRHLHIPSMKCMEVLAEMCDFTVEKVVFDSDERQFLLSEQYRRDIPLNDPQSYSQNNATTLFSQEEISSAKTRAARVNSERTGDQVGFYLKRPGESRSKR